MRQSNPMVLRLATGLLSVALALPSVSLLGSPCSADESFGGAVPVQALATIRGGDDTTIDSNNNVLTSTATQNTTATNQNNTITAGGDVIAGNVNVSNDAFTDMHGMTNVVINTAPMANVQGIMSLNLTLQ